MSNFGFPHLVPQPEFSQDEFVTAHWPHCPGCGIKVPKKKLCEACFKKKELAEITERCKRLAGKA